MKGFPELQELMPHREGMLLLRGLLAHGAEGTTCEVRSDSQAWLVDSADGQAPGWLALELMAQCVAAHESLRARAEGAPPQRGVLAGAEGLRLHAARLPVGRGLRVATRRVRGRPGLGGMQHACEVLDEMGTLLAEGRITVASAGGSAVAPEPRP